MGRKLYAKQDISKTKTAWLGIPNLIVLEGSGDDKPIEVVHRRYFEGEKLPRFTVINLNAPKLPPEKVKPMVVCPLDTGYFLDTYELRHSPNNRPYYWVQEVDTAELPIEPTTPGSDRYFLQEGHMTCSFVGHFGDENGKYTEKMQDLEK